MAHTHALDGAVALGERAHEVEPWWAREQPDIREVPVKLHDSPRPPLRREGSPTSITTTLDYQTMATGWEKGTRTLGSW